MDKYLIKYKHNKNVTYSCKYHIVWCKKYRRLLLQNQIEVDFKNIIQQVANDLNVEIIELEVMPDHVHLLVDVDPQFGVHKFIKTSKGKTSRLLRQKHKVLTTKVPTLWTNSYFISTVGGVSLDVIKQYIKEQKNV